MEWQNFRRSDNVEDKRSGDSGGIDPGSGTGFSVGAGHLGIGTIIVLGLVAWAFGIDPRVLIGGAEMIQGARQGYVQQSQNPAPQKTSTETGTPSDQMGQFVAAVLAQT